MAWPATAPIAPDFDFDGRTRRVYAEGAGGSLVDTLDTYAAGYVDGEAAGGGSPPTTGQLWPRAT